MNARTRRGPRGVALSALGACALLSGCGGGSTPEPEQLPDVILVVADTLRADHLSLHGYAVSTSPRLDAFAERATVYEAARSTAPWTLPSHASLMTGLHPFQHGAHTIPRGPGQVGARPLPAEAVTLAEALGDLGYRTLGAAANDVFLDRKYGLDQGFERWTVRRAPLEKTVPRLLRWIDEEPDRPLFLFVNTMDTHRPYLSREREGFLPRPVGRRSGELLDALYEAVMGRGESPDADDLQALVDEYDTSIANLDEAFGALLDGLEERGRLEGSVLAFTSDHGEYFGEHGLIEHSKDVYEPALRVPLVVRRPGQSTQERVGEPVSGADVARLLLAALPEEARSEVAELAPRLVDGGGGEPLAENRYSRGKDVSDPRFGERFWRERTALYSGPHKLIRSSDGAHELYDLAADPSESTNLVAGDPGLLTRLQQRLDALLADPLRLGGEAGAVEVDAAELRRLEALGYR